MYYEFMSALIRASVRDDVDWYSHMIEIVKSRKIFDDEDVELLGSLIDFLEKGRARLAIKEDHPRVAEFMTALYGPNCEVLDRMIHGNVQERTYVENLFKDAVIHGKSNFLAALFQSPSLALMMLCYIK